MTTPALIERNRGNATHSTGPRTAAGKGRSSRNALRHGLRSEAPVLAGESSEEWERHYAGILQSLAPVGALETELAGRVALSLWRLRRAAAFEAAVTAVGLEEVGEEVRRSAAIDDDLLPGGEKPAAVRLRKTRKALAKRRETVETWEGTLALLRRLPQLPDGAPLDGGDVNGALEDVNGQLPGDTYFDLEDERFLTGLGVPGDEVQDPWTWGGWSAGMVRTAIEQMAKKFKTNPEKAFAKALRGRERIQSEGRAECRRLAREAAQLERQVRAQEERLCVRRMLPDAPTLDKVMRYEAHLSRQMMQALHTLERLQAARAGQPVPPPAALDITVNGGPAAPTAALEPPGG
jgi:hypothetical protein